MDSTSHDIENTLQQQIYDIVLIADMTRNGDAGLRIRQEIQTYYDMGYQTALIHLPVPNKKAIVSPDIQRCVREGLASLVLPDCPIQAKLAIVYSPESLKASPNNLAGLRADKVVLVHDRKPNIEQMGLWFCFDFGPVSWAPTNRWVRAKLEELGMPVPIESEDWRPIGLSVQGRRMQQPGPRPIVVGRVSLPGEVQWPTTPAELEKIYAMNGALDFRVLGAPLASLLEQSKPSASWHIMNFEDTSVERFIEMLDVFMYYPSAVVPELPEAAIAAAMASGKIVVLPPRFQPHFGPGAIYVEPDQAIPTIKELFLDEEALEAARANAQYHCKFQFSATAHCEKIRALVGEGPRSTPAREKRLQRTKRVLLVPSNGVGLGHVTRLLAIARRMDHRVEPIFLSFAQAASTIESFGYLAEYFPSQHDSGASMDNWDPWLRHELGEVLGRYDIDAIVYDGNNPTDGMVQAALSNGGCRLAWVRRGMWGAAPSPYLENARFFDCIIEPGEIAGERDAGATAVRRHEAIMVNPIRLLDREELLPRDEALAALGLSADKPVVLLQLGGGSNRDILSLADRVINELKSFSNLQIVMAEWQNGLCQLPHWPNTHVLRGYPISRYFNAFNFSIAAAGYNTFHEVLEFGLPTIFLANRHPSMDDQAARAEFAQENSAGFDLPDDQLFHLPALCEALLNDKARDYVRECCLGLGRDNGAGEAASAVMNLMGVE